MAHLHQHTGQNHINFGSIGQKIVKVAEIGSAMKGIAETAIYLKYIRTRSSCCWCISFVI